MTIILGDCLDEMKKMKDNSIDFIVTDPPYGLTSKSGKGGFMGKKWDGKVPGMEIWQESLRICKPGAMLAAFGGSRTHHHLMLAIESAGWEIRDCVFWIQGQGFPKSHNFGNKLGNQWKGFGTALKPSYEIVICAQKQLSTNMEQDTIVKNLIKIWCQLCLMLPVNVAEKIFMSNHISLNEALNFAQINAEQKSNIQADLSVLMDMSQLEKALISCLNIVSLWKTTLEDLWSDGNMSTIKTKINQTIDLKILNYYLFQLTPLSIIQEETKQLGSWLNVLAAPKYLNAVEKSINAIQELSVLENAISKDGLNLNNEYIPITFAMKPLDGTFAHNAEKWGVAGLNIDDCRIGTGQDKGDWPITERNNDTGIYSKIENKTTDKSKGRWPANLILSEDASEELDQQTGNLKSGSIEPHHKFKLEKKSAFGQYAAKTGITMKGDSGGASRFFYCAKASSSERNKGLDGMPDKPSYMVENGSKTSGLNGERYERHTTHKNNHPTVKPIALMRYLLKLLAPPGNPIVLDPFAGSGSTLVAAKELGIRFIGIEEEPEYHAIAEARIKAVKQEEQLELPLT